MLPRRVKAARTASAGGPVASRVTSCGAVDVQQFWRLIDEASAQIADPVDAEAVAARAGALLSALPRAEIVAAERVLSTLLADSYRAQLWAAAYVINGGCSDDGFDYFRGWLRLSSSAWTRSGRFWTVLM
jgi:hypothetical protein